MSNERKHHSPEEKVAMLCRHLIEKAQVSDLCEEYHFHPSLFYRWLKRFFENGTAAFEAPARPPKQLGVREQRIAFLEGRLKKKDEVLAELMEEHVALKKSLGEI